MISKSLQMITTVTLFFTKNYLKNIYCRIQLNFPQHLAHLMSHALQNFERKKCFGTRSSRVKMFWSPVVSLWEREKNKKTFTQHINLHLQHYFWCDTKIFVEQEKIVHSLFYSLTMLLQRFENHTKDYHCSWPQGLSAIRDAHLLNYQHGLCSQNKRIAVFPLFFVFFCQTQGEDGKKTKCLN